MVIIHLIPIHNPPVRLYFTLSAAGQWGPLYVLAEYILEREYLTLKSKVLEYSTSTLEYIKYLSTSTYLPYE